jgi:putative oxidoreductase
MKNAYLIRIIYLVARTLLVGTFIISALKHLSHWGAALDEMASLGMPRSSILMAGSVTLRLAGGIAVLSGYQARIGACLLLAFVLPATFLGHAFWSMPPAKRPHELIEFLNNLAMAGGVMLVVVWESASKQAYNLPVPSSPLQEIPQAIR